MEEEKVFEFNATALQTTIDSNVEDLKAWVAEVSNSYQGGVVTYENRVAAKADLAMLRKLRKAIDSKVSGIKNDLLEPFTGFKAQVAEACRPIDDLIRELNSGLIRVEEERIAQKKSEVEELKNEILSKENEDVRTVVEGYWNDKWLNASTTEKQISADLASVIDQTVAALEAIRGSKFEAQLLNTFKQNYSYRDVTAKKKQLEEQDAELERIKALRAHEEAEKNAAMPAPAEDEKLHRPYQDPEPCTANDDVNNDIPAAEENKPAGENEILTCEVVFVGTKKEILRAVSACRKFAKIAVTRKSEFRTATMQEIAENHYEIKENN